METGTLGKTYEDGQEIFRQGEVGICMYVIQSGQVEVVREQDGRKMRVAVRSASSVVL